MEPYAEMYAKLFNKLTDLMYEIQKIQKETEDIFMKYSEKDETA